MKKQEIRRVLFLIASQNSKEISLLPKEKIDFLSQDSYFLESIYLQRLSPILDEIISKDRKNLLFSESFIEKIKKETNLLQIKNLNIIGELFKISEIFNERNIDYCLLKGPSLALEIYQDVRLRPLRDLDILVKRNQIKESLVLLEHLNYKSLEGDSKISGIFTDEDLDHYHHLPALYGPSDVIVEIHSRVTSPKNFKVCPLSEAMLSNTKEFFYKDFKTYFPSKEDNLLHLAVHSCLQHVFNNGLLTITDVSMIIKDESLDWDYVRKKSLNPKIGRSILIIMEMLKKHSFLQRNKDLLEDQTILKDLVSISMRQFFFHEEEHNALKGSRLKLLNSVSITRFISTLMESFFQHRDSFIRSRRFRNKNFGNYLFFFLYILKKITLDTGSIVKVFLKKDYKKYSKDKLRLLDWLDGNNDGIVRSTKDL